MNVLELNIPPGPVTRVVDDVIAHLKGLADLDGKLVFPGGVFRGLAQEKKAPVGDETPCCHVWTTQNSWAIKTIPPYPESFQTTIELFVFVWSLDQARWDEFAVAADNLLYWVGESFSDPRLPITRDNAGFAMQNKWRDFVLPQTVPVNDRDPLQKFGGAYKAAAGWIVRSLSFKIETMGEERP